MKAGWKTTEFWLSLAATVAGVLLESGLLGDGSTAAKIVGAASATLGALGYTYHRTVLKAGPQ